LFLKPPPRPASCLAGRFVFPALHSGVAGRGSQTVSVWWRWPCRSEEPERDALAAFLFGVRSRGSQTVSVWRHWLCRSEEPERDALATLPVM